MIKLNGYEIKPTIFPDGTSQVWHLPKGSAQKNNLIHWDFENEAEFVHVSQLVQLLTFFGQVHSWSLRVPYLPYARQDKDVSDNSTFALHTFACLLSVANFEKIEFVDVHSDLALRLIKRSVNIPATEFINNAIVHTSPTLLCYPDKGARDRYSALELTGNLSSCSFSKTRDQATGHISGLSVNEDVDVYGHTMLIIDDICDGGMTFKLAAEKLINLGAKEVHLYVSHGIFSKGLQTLRDSGISRIFTHKGEVTNG